MAVDLDELECIAANAAMILDMPPLIDAVRGAATELRDKLAEIVEECLAKGEE